MKLIRPTEINDARLVSSTVPETDHAVWSSATTYALSARVIKNHRIWESTQAANLNHNPEIAGLAWWVDIGPTNRWGMFDNKVGTVTSADLSMTITLSPGRVNALALLQISGAAVEVTMTNAGETVYTHAESLIDNSIVTDWYAYFMEPIREKDTLLLTDLNIFSEGQISITLTALSGPVSCGACIVGTLTDLGDTLASPSIGINDYSKKTTNEFGVTTLVQRSYAKRMGVRLTVENRNVDRIHAILAALRATPVIWIGDSRYSSMLIYGFFRDFEIDIAFASFSYCTLNIEGMI